MPSAITKSSINWISMFSQLEVTNDISTFNKSDLRLNLKKELKSKLLLKCRLWKLIIRLQEFFRFNFRTLNLYAFQSSWIVKSLKSHVSRSFSKLTKVLGWLRYLLRKIKLECHQFHLKICQTLTLQCRSKQ